MNEDGDEYDDEVMSAEQMIYQQQEENKDEPQEDLVEANLRKKRREKKDIAKAKQLSKLDQMKKKLSKLHEKQVKKFSSITNADEMSALEKNAAYKQVIQHSTNAANNIINRDDAEQNRAQSQKNNFNSVAVKKRRKQESLNDPEIALAYQQVSVEIDNRLEKGKQHQQRQIQSSLPFQPPARPEVMPGPLYNSLRAGQAFDVTCTNCDGNHRAQLCNYPLVGHDARMLGNPDQNTRACAWCLKRATIVMSQYMQYYYNIEWDPTDYTHLDALRVSDVVVQNPFPHHGGPTISHSEIITRCIGLGIVQGTLANVDGHSMQMCDYNPIRGLVPDCRAEGEEEVYFAPLNKPYPMFRPETHPMKVMIEMKSQLRKEKKYIVPRDSGGQITSLGSKRDGPIVELFDKIQDGFMSYTERYTGEAHAPKQLESAGQFSLKEILALFTTDGNILDIKEVPQNNGEGFAGLGRLCPYFADMALRQDNFLFDAIQSQESWCVSGNPFWSYINRRCHHHIMEDNECIEWNPVKNMMTSVNHLAKTICKCCGGDGHIELNCGKKKNLDKLAQEYGFGWEWGVIKYATWWKGYKEYADKGEKPNLKVHGKKAGLGKWGWLGSEDANLKLFNRETKLKKQGMHISMAKDAKLSIRSGVSNLAFQEDQLEAIEFLNLDSFPDYLKRIGYSDTCVWKGLPIPFDYKLHTGAGSLRNLGGYAPPQKTNYVNFSSYKR